MLPGTILYVVGTDSLITGLKEGRVPWSLLAVVGLMLVFIAFIVKKAKRRLSDEEV